MLQNTVNAQYTVLWIILSPLFGALLTPLKRIMRVLYYAALFGITLSNIASLVFHGYDTQPIRFGTWFIFSLDVYSMAFAVLLNVCWALTVIYSHDYMRYEFQKRAVYFCKVFSAALSLIVATGLAGNLFTIFFFYTLSIPMIYPLITMRKTQESFSAGKFYLRSTLGPAICLLLPALLYLNCWFLPFQDISIRNIIPHNTAASLILGAIILGFSRNCIAPFYAWLPKSAVAPGPVSALIHSVGAVHTSTIAVLKIGVYVYGIEYLSSLSDNFFETGWLLYLCGGTAVYTALRAYKASNLKKRFSFSTVGQLSYVITAILVGTVGSVQGAMLHIITHALAKINLFFSVGMLHSVYGTAEAPAVAKIIPKHRLLAVAMAISGLSIAGFPMLAGYYSKHLMLLEEINTHHYAAAACLMAGSILNFVYIWPVIRAALWGKSEAGFIAQKLPRGMSLAIFITAVLVLLAPWVLPI